MASDMSNNINNNMNNNISNNMNNNISNNMNNNMSNNINNNINNNTANNICSECNTSYKEVCIFCARWKTMTECNICSAFYFGNMCKYKH